MYYAPRISLALRGMDASNQKALSSFLCHQRNEAKKMPLKIAAYILTKTGNRVQNKARVLL